VSTLPLDPHEAWFAGAALCALAWGLGVLAGRRLAAVLLAAALAGCAPHDSPRRFGRQQPTPIGNMRVLFSTDLASRRWAEEAARLRWQDAVGLQQVAASFGIGSAFNGSPTVYVIPGLHVDARQPLRRYRIDAAGGIWIAEGERSTLPDLTHALLHFYFFRPEDHSFDPTFWQVVVDTDEQRTRRLTALRQP